MPNLQKTILSPEQCNVFTLLKEARKRWFYMVGGTAIALHIGHRKSIDFDLFRDSSFRSETISNILSKSKKKWQALHISTVDNYTWVIDDVKVTFFHFPFPIDATVNFDWYIKIPDLLTLAAMKAYALGRRAKWKDYVDLYFILKDHYTMDEIGKKATTIFWWNFNTRLFREQLCYFEYINYSEWVDYLMPSHPTDEEIRAFLLKKALE